MQHAINVRSMGWTRRDFARYFQELMTERYRKAGLLVKAERIRQGHTHESLAARAGLSAKTVARAEHGGLHETRGSTYRKLAEALGVPIEQFTAPLLDDEDDDAVARDGGRAASNGSSQMKEKNQ